MRRLFLWMLLCGWLVAPPNRAQQPQQPDQPPTLKIGVTVENVVAPVLVFDKDGSYVNNIRPDQFHLYDNTKEQNISVDVVYQPISLVIAIQANSHVEQLLPHVGIRLYGDDQRYGLIHNVHGDVLLFGVVVQVELVRPDVIDIRPVFIEDQDGRHHVFDGDADSGGWLLRSEER